MTTALDIKLATLYRSVNGRKGYRIDRVDSGYQVCQYLLRPLPGIDPKNPHAEVEVLTLDRTMIVPQRAMAESIVAMFIK